MDDKDLGQRILKFISSKSKKSEATSKIVQALRATKKSVNHQLYKLERDGHIVKVQETPPVWGLAELASDHGSFVQPVAGRKEVQQDLVWKVIRFLQTCGKLAKSLEIAKAVNLSRVVEINPTLYHLEKQGVIEKCIMSPPTWALIKGCPGEEELFGSQSHHDAASPGSSRNEEQRLLGDNDGAVPDFQETALFPPNIRQDSVETGKSRIKLESMEYDEDRSIAVNRDHSITDGHGVAPADGHDDTPAIVKREESDPYASIVHSIVDVERTALAKRGKMVEDIAAAERDVSSSTGGGVTTVGVADLKDTLGIDYPISSDDESSDGSIDGMDFTVTEAGSNDTHMKISGTLSPTDTGNMSDTGIAAPDADTMKKEEANATAMPADYNIAESKKGIVDYADMDMVDDREAVVNGVTDAEMDDVGADASAEEMADCNKVLKVLATLPGTTQFVLSKKSQLAPDKLTEALKKCESLNLISGSAKLWKITPSGEKYTKKAFSEEDLSNSTIGPQVVLPTKVKQVYQGPPPPPRAILKDKGMLNNEESFSVSHHMNVSNSQQNFDIPSSSQVKQSQTTSNSAAPKPLMSLTFNSPPFLTSTGTTMPSSSLTSSASTKHSSFTSGSSSKSVSSIPNFPAQQLLTSSAVRSVQSSLSLSSRSAFPEQCMEASRLSGQSSASFSTVAGSPADVSGQNQMSLNSGLWDIQNPTASLSGKKLQTFAKGVDQSRKSVQNKQATSSKSFQVSKPPPEPVKREIPEKYADYPNQSTSMQSLKTKIQRKGNSGQSDPSKSAFSKGPPPSPLDILSKGLKRTEISAISSQPAQTVYQPSISSGAQTLTSTFTAPNPPRQILSGNQSSYSNMGNQLTGSGAGAQTMGKFASQPLALNTESFAALNKNPVSALMEYAQCRKMSAKVEVLSRKGAAHKPTFVMAAFMGDRQFPTITCTNKKDGRKEACDIALRQLVAEGQFQQGNGSGDTSMPAVPSDNMTHFDKIAALTHRGFTALVSQITTESFAGRKVIAGLVMKRSDTDTGVLISLGTGNRCITGQQLSLQGNTVNDSHAEIITRRGFLRFLYKQLLDYDPNKPSPMFEPSAQQGKLQIRPNISFHLYISTAPCGDGALFSPRDVESQKLPVDTRYKPEHNPTFSSNVQGLLRTKVEGGEGTIPVEAGFKGLTFDGIQRGERLLTMSCTDKICRWNVVGMQGALLSHFLEPIYLDSLTLGLLFDPGHLSRAVCCRVERGPSDIQELLPEGYRLNHPWLGRVTACDPPREIQKTKALSINWSFGDNGPEVTDGTQGLCYTSIEKGFFSRCSKRNLFTSFKRVCEKFERTDLVAVTNYKEAKTLAQDFQAARQALLAKFKENKFGKWVSKPVEEEMFDFNEQH